MDNPTGQFQLRAQLQVQNDRDNSDFISVRCQRCIRCFRELELALCDEALVINALALQQTTGAEITSPQQIQEIFPGLLERFKIWAVNCGAHRTGRSSLDHRLREALHVHQEVLSLLQDLEDALNEGIRSIRQPSSPGLTPDIDPMSEVEPLATDAELEDDVESLSDQPIRSDLEYAILDATHVLKCLYQFSTTLHKPVPIDRLKKCATVKIDSIWDVSHAIHKFPAAPGYLQKRLGIANTKRRQLLMYQARHHRKIAGCGQLEADTRPSLGRKPTGPEKVSVTGIEILSPTATLTDPRAEHLHKARSISPGPDKKHTSNEFEDPEIDLQSAADIQSTMRSEITDATTFRQSNDLAAILTMKRMHTEDQQSDTGQSQTSFASSYASASMGEQRLAVPEPPNDINDEDVLDGRPFECPYCHDIISARGKRAWKAHVFSDLMPYVCTFEACPRSDDLFSSRQEWFEHETQVHRREWYCESCNKVFSEKAAIISHLESSHKGHFKGSENHPSLNLKWFERAATSKQTCPLCPLSVLPTKEHLQRYHKIVREFENEGIDADTMLCPYCPVTYDSRQLRRHLGRHMQQLSLFTLPRLTDDESDQESIMSNKARGNDEETESGFHGDKGSRGSLSSDDGNDNASTSEVGSIQHIPDLNITNDIDICLDHLMNYVIDQNLAPIMIPDLQGPELNANGMEKLRIALQQDAQDVSKLHLRLPHIDPDLLADLSVLALYDLAILIEDSKEMASEENGEPIKTLKRLLQFIIHEYSTITNGRPLRTIRFMQDRHRQDAQFNFLWDGNRSNTDQVVDDFIDKHKPDDWVTVAAALEKEVLKPHVFTDELLDKTTNEPPGLKLSRPLLVIIFTYIGTRTQKENLVNLSKVISQVRERESRTLRATRGGWNNTKCKAVKFQFVCLATDPSHVGVVYLDYVTRHAEQMNQEVNSVLGAGFRKLHENVVKYESNPNSMSLEEQRQVFKVLLGAIDSKYEESKDCGRKDICLIREGPYPRTIWYTDD